MLHVFAERWMAYAGAMLWQTSIAMIAVWIIYLACRRRSAAIRYALRLRRRFADAREVRDPAVLDLLADCAAELGIRRSVKR